jgi:hypothetical protein
MLLTHEVNLTLKATGAQQTPRSGNLLLRIRVGRPVRLHSSTGRYLEGAFNGFALALKYTPSAYAPAPE